MNSDIREKLLLCIIVKERSRLCLGDNCSLLNTQVHNVRITSLVFNYFGN